MNLVIGNTSQISHYFPNSYEKISSRNIDFKSIKNKKYKRIYLTFAEQRTFLNEDESFFLKTNFDYTIFVIDELKNYCDNIIIFSTSELWNNYDSAVSVDMKYDYNYSPYIKSKEVLCNYINEKKCEYKNVIIIYPFNFNTPYRNKNFLFGKIFDSIINRKKISVGDLNFYRDLIHPSVIVNNSIETNQDLLIGGGELINLYDFINDLYALYNLKLNDYILMDNVNNLKNKRENYYSKIIYSSYKELIDLTSNDLQKYILGQGHH
jgi:nucleoside-diphosphate-sugar epimerase